MKRFLTLGALSLAFSAASLQEASAWINSNFGAGLNWGVQCGGNDLGWGLFRCGQPCGPDMHLTHTPVYPRPCCCVAPVQTVVQPQVFCPPAAPQIAPPQVAPPQIAPAPHGHGHGHGLGLHPAAAAPTQSLRVPYYRPQPVSMYHYGR